MVENVDIRLVIQRLDRMEAAQRETSAAQQEMHEAVSRIVALVDGSPAYRIIGIPVRLDAVIKADNEWKRATEQHLMSQDARIKTIEQTNSPLVITRATLVFMVLIGTVCLVAAFLLLTWLQSAG